MKLESKTVNLRLIECTDAEFVLSLRLDDRYNKFLSKTTPDLNSQREWIKNYKYDESKGEQFYFIIERKDGTPCGTIRLYDLRNESFCWGSWILNENKTRYAALESAFLLYDFGFEKLGFIQSHFDVMKGNEKVISFHKKMGAIQVSEDANNFYFEISKAAVESKKLILMDKLL